MQKLLLIITIIVMLIITGCSGTTVSPEKNATSSPAAEITSAASSTATVISTATPEKTTVATTTPTPEITEETATPEATSAPTVIIKVVEDELLAAYMEKIIPIVESHLTTRDNLTTANNVFTYAWGLDAVASYRDALAAAKASVEVELRDASAITPPHHDFDIFHSNLVTALTREQEGITKHHAYYSEVADEGTSEQALYDDGLIFFQVADDLWWNNVIPEFDRMRASLNS